MTQAEFDGEKQSAFKEAIAKAAKVASAVTIDKIAASSTRALDQRRQLLAQEGVRVDFKVMTTDKENADAVAASLTEDNINSELEKAGLPSVRMLQAATVGNIDAESIAILPLGGPMGSLGSTFAISIVFTGFIFWFIQDAKQKGLASEHGKIVLMQDFFDCALDWSSWGGTYLSGDFVFSNDENNVIYWTVGAISICGTVLFLLEIYMFFRHNGRLSKYVMMVRMGLEDCPQAVLYAIVMSSQTDYIGAGMACGFVQALVFCLLQIAELWFASAKGAEGIDDASDPGPPPAASFVIP